MSEVKWIKLTTDMFDDEKIRLIESLPEADTILIIWVKLLAQAGKTNASGYLYLNPNFPYTDEMLSTLFRRPLGSVRMALEVLKNFGMIEIDEDKFISITNWEKHQNIEGMEKMREQARLRKQKQRENKKLEMGKKDQSRDMSRSVQKSHATEVEVEREEELEREEVVAAPAAAAYPDTLIQFIESELMIRLSPTQAQSLFAYQDDFNGDESILRHAVKLASDKNRRYFGFVEYLLREWAQNRVESLEGALAYELEKFGKSKGAGRGKPDLSSFKE